ncbi:MAG TPA: hypothetical protein VMZ91_12830 [Candidatus Paceibacterota bacterium]|nr:hypothetical protein [Candidatus Paceibacterota bacterium]
MLEFILEEGDVIKITGEVPISELAYDKSLKIDRKLNSKKRKLTGLYVVEYCKEQNFSNSNFSVCLIESRRLREDRTYNPKGRLLKFSLNNGLYDDKLDQNFIEIVGKMEKTYFWKNVGLKKKIFEI